MKNPDRFNEGLMQAAMLGLMPPKIIAAVTEAFTPDKLSLDDLRFLKGPLVVHESPWNVDRPAWLAEQAGAERIGIVFGVTPQYIIGPAELATVMYGASLDAPLSHYHADLYIWATVNAVAKRDGKTAQDVWHGLFGGNLGMGRPIEDREVLEPGGRLYETYREIAHDVRRRVISQQAERDRGVKRRAREEQRETGSGRDTPLAVPPAATPQAAAVQMTMFGGKAA